VVPGHGNLGGLELADDVGGYLDALEQIASTDLGIEAMEAEVRRRYPTWEHPSYIAPALGYFAR